MTTRWPLAWLLLALLVVGSAAGALAGGLTSPGRPAVTTGPARTTTDPLGIVPPAIREQSTVPTSIVDDKPYPFW